jgi:hypothetical protein
MKIEGVIPMNNKENLKSLEGKDLTKIIGGIKVSQDFKNAFFGPIYEHYRGTKDRFGEEDFGQNYAGSSTALLTLGTSWIIGGIYGKIKGKKQK